MRGCAVLQQLHWPFASNVMIGWNESIAQTVQTLRLALMTLLMRLHRSEGLAVARIRDEHRTQATDETKGAAGGCRRRAGGKRLDQVH